MNKEQMGIPTEIVDLPSRGLLYPETSPLSKGHLEMRYMTAAMEDILTNQNFIIKGIVYDELLKALIVDDINFDELLQGDKDALLISARILSYGKDYSIKTVNGQGNIIDKIVDLSRLKDKELILDTQIRPRENEFSFLLPNKKIPLTFKLLTHGDEKNIQKELESIKKLFPDKPLPESSTRLKYVIKSVDGDTDQKTIREFIDKGGLLAIDSKELKKEIKRISPGVDLLYKESDDEEGIQVPIGLNFFWPESTI